jgi:hypothetical protein
MFGDWQGDIAASIAGGDLDKVTAAIRGLSAQVTSVVAAKNSILNGYLTAKRNYDSAVALFGPPVIPMPLVGLAPNPKIYPFLQALTAAGLGVKLLARKAHMLTKLNLVFGQIAAALMRAGLSTDSASIDGVSRQIGRFTVDVGTSFSGVPLYAETIRSLNDAADQEWRLGGVDPSAQNDPNWLKAYLKAADKVVPLPAAAGMSGFAGLGNPLAPVLVVLIAVIAAVAAAVVAIKVASMAIDALNSKAVTAREILLTVEERKRQVQIEMIKAGKSKAEIDAAMKKIDEETNETLKKIPESGLLSSLAVPVGIAVAALVGLKVAGAI